ncbi:threonine--tRNA ligase [Patescibacteria group bacterium]|nr:threonine--tRNA ligase [Patescibacteria group bacterium]MBU4016092.1 threonine--tRNA ligase [Patescibacteria group bacterium]MBU4098687.1 threonine--tRNA ligase [Patescibacteria group bacterium]
MEKAEKMSNMRHTLAHLLAASVGEIYKFNKIKLTLGPATENGFYYDIDFCGEKVTDENLQKIENMMRKKLPLWTEWEHKEISKDEALKFFKNEYKAELINEIAERGEKITTYTCGGFTDLCRGGHVENPAREIKMDSFKLDRLAGAYWRGDEKNKMLTRIYGLAFNTKEELEKYINQREEAKKRDHRKIAKEQDLLVFSDLIGAGMPMFTPKGNIIRNSIINFSRELNKELGFEEVHTPNFNKAELFKISGHYDKYKEDMLTVHSKYSEEDFFLKPMNCPQHTQIYASRPRSYRDLPIRYSDFANLYRDERPGELSGLVRLRCFAQDDGHVFCCKEQIEEEISNILAAIQKALQTYKISYWMRLSLRDQNNNEKYLGTDEIWESSQAIMKKLLDGNKITYNEAEGEAAFYGPKIDIMAVDAFEREWQISTIQLDFSQPSRFKLTYTDKDGTEKTPVMIHRALIGSPDRFMGILMEHYAGAFPLWLSPVQVKIIPVRTNHNEYAKKVFETLKKNNIRVEFDNADINLGTKVRDAKNNKIPYWIVIGDKDIAIDKVTLMNRDDGNLGQLNVSEILIKFQEEILKKI